MRNFLPFSVGLASICGLVVAAALLFGQIETPPPGEADLIQFTDSDLRDHWVVYQQGGSTHMIRVAAIGAILDMGQGGRSTIYFSGGKLQTDHSVKEWISIYEEELAEHESEQGQ